MERLDYIISEDDMARRVSYQRVMAILGSLYPAIADQLESDIRWKGESFITEWAGKRIEISYRGLKNREAL